VAYALDASSTAANTAPLYRFYNKVQGVHFYTADAGERDRLIHTMANLYRYEGVAYYVSLSPTGTSPVYRFYNFKKGVHFYTASADERDSVIAKLRSTYRYEGVAFSYDPPW
jgi:hypothetical protein